ncbi:hypothetical protein AAFF_G00333410 [Aldrovandia affinis]|uniref:Uncharacterized protein n=1 Tax=Aldrovandia affinis TaxID=143900 RepID=A0AAD7R6N6_9TELE|nr:hypothetical protein AAFF_G00333410 [Aldrovandia affinis]
MDRSEEPSATALHASRLSELSALHNASLDLHIRPSPLDRCGSQPPEGLSTSGSLDSIAGSASVSALGSLEAEKVKDFEQLSVTLSPSPVWASDGYGSNMSSELGTRLNVELAVTERLDANFVEYLQNRGVALEDQTDSTAGDEEPSLDLLSPELQVLLKRVYQEGCRVLTLSHRPAGDAPPSGWQTEKRALQQTVLSLRELLCKMAAKRLQTDGGDADWRAELLQAVRSVFDSERLSLHSELLDLITAHGHPDPAALTSHLEQLLKQQEERQRQSLEQLLCAEQHSLLAEVHSLHAQLRIASLQSQEQLQRLQGSLSATQEDGGQQQHQLRRQVELLEYRLQQEQTCAEDLRGSLRAEQGRAAEQCAVRRAEQGAVEQLKREVEESSVQLSTSSRAQEELQHQARRLRTRLENEEAERRLCEETAQLEQLQTQRLQEELEQERLRSRSRQEQEEQAQQVLQSQLQDLSAQITELRAVLEHERVANANLRLELQIEQSRCQALISQERNRTSDALTQLEDQRARCAQLTDALIQEKQDYSRKLEERLIQEKQDYSRKLEERLIQEKQDYSRKLEEKQDYSRKLEETQDYSRKLEERLIQEKQDYSRKLEEKQDYSRKLEERLIQEKQDYSRKLEEKQDYSRKLEERLIQEKQDYSRKLEERLIQEKQDYSRKLEEQDYSQELEERLIQEKQDYSRKMEERQDYSRKLEEVQQRDRKLVQELESQLGQVCRQREELAAQLKHLQEQATAEAQQNALRERPRRPEQPERDHRQQHRASEKVSAAPTASGLVDRVLEENLDLSSRLAALSQDKVALKHTVSCLERELQAQRRSQATREQLKSPEPVNAALLSEKLAWQKERSVLQAALRKAESDLSCISAEASDHSSSKMHRLYGKYLRCRSPLTAP